VLAGQWAKKPKPATTKTARERRRGEWNWQGRELACLGDEENQLTTDLVLVVPEAGNDIDRIEWAKQLVANAVRSPHTRQAYHYALEQFFQWAAGRAVSRESVQGYVT
jgi:hypothetical protein